MTEATFSKLHDLLDRLDTIAQAYACLGRLAASADQVPSDWVGVVMMPIDAQMDGLLDDFRAFQKFLREAS